MIHIIGAGGHGSVVAECFLLQGEASLRILDADPARHGKACLHWTIEDEEACLRDLAPGARFHVAIGDSAARRTVTDRWIEAGHRPVSSVHPRGILSPSARTGEGSVVMAGAVVQTGARLGRGVIVNTGATVDHDARIGDFAHVAPGAHLAGDAEVGEGAWIGLGALILEGRRVGAGSTVGAGSIVTRDIPAGVTAWGSPCRVREAAPH